MGTPVIIEGVRLPLGKVNGIHRATRSEDLLARAIQGLLSRTAVPPTKIDDLVVGCVTQSGEQGGNVARLGGLLAGLPVEVPATTVNRWCGSGQQAIHAAAQGIAAGDLRCAIAAGVENMSRVPVYSDIGGLENLHPDVVSRYRLVHQAESGERIAEMWNITREDADQFGMESQRRAAWAAQRRMHTELLPYGVLDDSGREWSVTRDEGIRDTIDPAKVASLRLAYRPDGQGVLTAANCSQFADGAAAVLLADEAFANELGWKPRARFLARVAAAADPALALMAIVPATQEALRRSQLSLDQIDWFEVNEAFSTVVLAWQRALGVPSERINPWGGAIAHGHALGATGCVLLSKMLTGLEATRGRYGLQVMTIGHGQATASVVERLA
jgi:acetyl-CoA C-acetyltransferase/acetyl-CoA acyltransferase